MSITAQFLKKDFSLCLRNDQRKCTMKGQTQFFCYIVLMILIERLGFQIIKLPVNPDSLPCLPEDVWSLWMQWLW